MTPYEPFLSGPTGFVLIEHRPSTGWHDEAWWAVLVVRYLNGDGRDIELATEARCLDESSARACGRALAALHLGYPDA